MSGLLALAFGGWAPTPVCGQDAGAPDGVSTPETGATETPSAGGVEAWRPPSAIEDRVVADLGARWGVSADSIEVEWQRPSRPLPDGAEPARLLGSGRSGAWILMLESEDERSSLRFRAGLKRRVQVALVDLPRDAVLVESEIGESEAIVWGPPSADPAGPDPAPGWVTRRPIARGEVLSRPSVEPPAIVTSGSVVTVHWTVGRVTLEVVGQAIGDGALGETVQVRLRTGLRVRGVVTDPGTVKLIEPGQGRSAARPQRKTR